MITYYCTERKDVVLANIRKMHELPVCLEIVDEHSTLSDDAELVPAAAVKDALRTIRSTISNILEGFGVRTTLWLMINDH